MVSQDEMLGSNPPPGGSGMAVRTGWEMSGFCGGGPRNEPGSQKGSAEAILWPALGRQLLEPVVELRRARVLLLPRDLVLDPKRNSAGIGASPAAAARVHVN